MIDELEQNTIKNWIELAIEKDNKICVISDTISYYNNSKCFYANSFKIIADQLILSDGNKTHQIDLREYETYETIYGYELGCTFSLELFKVSAYKLLKEKDRKIKDLKDWNKNLRLELQSYYDKR